MAIPKKYAHIDFYPTKQMQKNAIRGLELRERGGGGGLTTREAGKQKIGSGVARAVQLKHGRKLQPDTVRRMLAFFQRHKKNAKVDPGKKPEQDRGYVAWLLWGGDAGFTYARRVVRQMNKADEG